MDLPANLNYKIQSVGGRAFVVTGYDTRGTISPQERHEEHLQAMRCLITGGNECRAHILPPYILLCQE